MDVEVLFPMLHNQLCDIEQRVGDKNDDSGEIEHVEQRTRHHDVQHPCKSSRKGYRNDAARRSDFFPPFVNQDAQSVESAPGDEVEAGAVPESAQEHGVHVVDVGVELFAVLGEEDVNGDEQRDDCRNHQCGIEVFGHQGDDDENAAQNHVGRPRGTAVASKGNVEIVF